MLQSTKRAQQNALFKQVFDSYILFHSGPPLQVLLKVLFNYRSLCKFTDRSKKRPQLGLKTLVIMLVESYPIRKRK